MISWKYTNQKQEHPARDLASINKRATPEATKVSCHNKYYKNNKSIKISKRRIRNDKNRIIKQQLTKIKEKNKKIKEKDRHIMNIKIFIIKIIIYTKIKINLNKKIIKYKYSFKTNNTKIFKVIEESEYKRLMENIHEYESMKHFKKQLVVNYEEVNNIELTLDKILRDRLLREGAENCNRYISKRTEGQDTQAG